MAELPRGPPLPIHMADLSASGRRDRWSIQPGGQLLCYGVTRKLSLADYPTLCRKDFIFADAAILAVKPCGSDECASQKGCPKPSGNLWLALIL